MKIKNVIALIRNVKVKTFRKGECLIEAGEPRKFMFYIRKGLIRSYYVNHDNEEITFQLYPEGHVCGNIHAVLFDEPSEFHYQALEAVKVYAIDYEVFLKSVSKNPDLLGEHRGHFAKKAIKQAFLRVQSFVFMSPEERYLQYVKDYPNVFNRAPDKYIAHVLGITPVSLSRIRGRISSKKK